MKVYEGKYPPVGTGKIAIVVAKYNKAVTERLLEGALAKLRDGGIRDDDIVVAWVPGAFEIPTMAERFAIDDEYQAVICLGCVIKGETSHDEHINRAVSIQLARIGVDSGIPVIFGILTCNTVEQAMARSAMQEGSNDKTAGEVLGNKGIEAAEAALEMLDIFSQLPELEEEEPEIDPELLASICANSKRYRSGEFDDQDEDDAGFEESPEEYRRPFPKEREFEHRERRDRNYRKDSKDRKHSFEGKRFKGDGKHEFKDFSKKGKPKFSKKGK